MAVVDKELYGDDKAAADTIVSAFKHSGVDALFIQTKFEITSGDSATSIYRFAQVPSNYIPYDIKLNCETLTNVSDIDIGLYETQQHSAGMVLDKDIFLDGADISGGKAIGSEQNCMTTLSIDNHGKQFYALVSSKSGTRQAYDLALTMNTLASATGTVMVRSILLAGQSGI